jgi:hypothetical protein
MPRKHGSHILGPDLEERTALTVPDTAASYDHISRVVNHIVQQLGEDCRSLRA